MAGEQTRAREFDEPGNVRPQDGDGDGVAVCDVGAYEAPTIALKRVYLPLVLRNGR